MKTLLTLLLLLPIGIFAQTVDVNYQDGKIWFKLDNEVRLLQPLVENSSKIPVQSIPGLNQLISKYGFINLSKPFAAAKNSEILQRTYLLEFSAIQDVEKCIEDLENLKGVEYAEKVPLDRMSLTPNDPSYSSQWGLSNINAPGAWNYFSSGSNVVVAIVDDAVERTHADLSPNLWMNVAEIAGNNIDDDNNGYIDDINGYDVGSNDNNPNPPNSAFDHGTHVAGIVSARSNNGVGVASIGFSCKLMCVKSTTTVGQITNGYDGIIYAAVSGAHVINMSWGGPSSSITAQNIIDYAAGEGCILIAAAGNDNVNTQFYPAAYNNVVSVAATTSTNTKASFSNYGSWIDVSAPGNNIYSTTVGNTYGNKSGTSMASPMVAGLVGLMKSLNPSMPNTDLINCLLTTAANINAQNPSFIGQLGSGRIDAAAAMACVSTSLNNPPIADFSANFTTISAGGSVVFTNLSTYNPTSWSWTFTGGTPASFNGQNPPSITYNTPGTYSVSLTATNANGTDTETKTGYIIVNPAAVCEKINLPVPAGWAAANYFTGASVGADGWINGMNVYLDKQKAMYFDASASPNTILNNIWVAFGLAYSANPSKIVPVNIYDGTSGTPGALIGSSNLTMGQIMSDVDGGFYTEASFVNNPITLPASKKFFVSLGLTNLQWSVGVKDTLSIVSNSVGQTTPSAIWEQQSDNLWYHYGTAGSWNLNASLYIHPFLTNTPSQAIITPSALTICSGNSIEFDAAGSTYQDTLLWYFPGGTPTVLPSAPTASVTYATPGTYDAILYTIGGGCALFDSAFVSITVNPTPTISVSGDNTICNGSSTPLIASGASSFTWTPSTGLSATTGNNVTANPIVTTTYAITGTLGSCSNSTNITINVDNPSVASITFVDSTVACPTSVSFDGSNSMNADGFSWSFPGGSPATSNSSSPTITFGTSGSITVELTTSNTCGTNTATFPIDIILGNPTPINLTANSTICNGSSTSITASGATNYSWSPATGLSATTGDVVTANPTTTTTYSVAGTQGACTNSSTITIIVEDPSLASIVFVDSTVACPTSVSFDGSNSTNATSFSWSFPGGLPAISNNSSPTTTFDNDGTVIVQLITNNTCGPDTTTFPIVMTTTCGLGLNDSDINYMISLSSDQSVIYIISDQGLTANTTIQLYNELGQLLILKRLENQAKSFEIPISSYASGMYFVRIISESHEVTSKLIK